MNCLWLTLADPDPATNGQLIYSKGLIEATSRSGASLHVVGLARSEKRERPRSRPGLIWDLAEERVMSRWRRLASPIPNVAMRCATPAMLQAIDAALASRDWDAVVFDSICPGWAVGSVARHRKRIARPPCLVYLGHNHETTAAQRIAGNTRGTRKLQKMMDALKVARLERRLVAAADLVTADSPDDCRIFAAEAPGKLTAYLPPGYDGPRVMARTIDADVPRRAVVVSSADWPPKRFALERLLEAATPLFDRAGVELQIVGEANAAYLAQLRQRFPSVRFEGRVDDVRPYMAAARIALVPDVLGGFKLKGLDYVFNRLPILSMREALPGMPLDDGVTIGLFDDHKGMAEEVIRLIDDYPVLNARQDKAFAACTDRFDWDRIARRLVIRIRQASTWRTATTARTAAVRPVQAEAD